MSPARPLMDHQISGARFIGPRRRSLLLDDPGLGKTCTSITALDMRHKKWENGLRGIVECPAIARSNWLKEFKMWTNVPRRYVIAEDLHDLIFWERKKADVLIASWEFITKWSARFDDRMDWMDFYLGDEFHRGKAEESKRKVAMMGKDGRGGVSAWAHWGCGLSGTISPNDPVDLFNPLQWTGIIKSDRASFTKRYFKTKEGIRSSSNKPIKEMVPELRGMMDKVAIRRTLEDAGIVLPPISFSNVILDGDRSDLLEFLSHHPGLSEEIYEAIRTGNLAHLDSPHIATVRRLIGEAKALPYADILVKRIHSGAVDKVLVMGFHRTAFRLIQERLTRAGIRVGELVGGQSRTQSDAAIRGFEEDRTLDALLVNHKTGGEALTFVSNRFIDLFERPWNPGAVDQIVRRSWRIGQTRPVDVLNFTLRDSYDESVNRIIETKNENMGVLGLKMVCDTGREIRAA